MGLVRKVNVRVENQKLCLGLDLAKDKERIHFRKYTVGNCLGLERKIKVKWRKKRDRLNLHNTR